MKKRKEDTRPTERIVLEFGDFTHLVKHFGVMGNTIRRYIQGGAITPGSKANAKKVREYVPPYPAQPAHTTHEPYP